LQRFASRTPRALNCQSASYRAQLGLAGSLTDRLLLRGVEALLLFAPLDQIINRPLARCNGRVNQIVDVAVLLFAQLPRLRINVSS
jgi:hypothetical protein